MHKTGQLTAHRRCSIRSQYTLGYVHELSSRCRLRVERRERGSAVFWRIWNGNCVGEGHGDMALTILLRSW